MSESTVDTQGETFAVDLARGSFDWYKSHAIRSRRWYKLSETALIVVSGAIPLSVALAPGTTAIPAVLGFAVVVLSGLRTVFHWQENYLRYSAAREAVDAERRRYRIGAAPYDDPATRDTVLVAAVTRIEQDEMNGWIQIATERPKA